MSGEKAIGHLQTKTSRFEWKIDKYLGNCEKTGDCYNSPKFAVQYTNQIVTNWQLQIFPKGHNEESKDYVSIDLYLHGNKIDVIVDCEFTILNKQNVIMKHKFPNKVFKKVAKGAGCATIIMPNIRSAGSILNNDTITIICELTIHPPAQDDTNILVYSQWVDNIGKGFGDYEQLLELGLYSDVMFTVQDKKINSHKAILSCRSPVFKAMFEHQMKENEQNIVDVTDIDYDVMMELLRFLYSGKVKNIRKIASDLLFAADKYQVIELKAVCENTLFDDLSSDNAVDYLKMIELCDTIHLKRLVIDFTAANYKVIMRNSGFEDLSNKIMYQILSAIANLDTSTEK